MSSEERSLENKKSHWINWFVPLLLVVISLAMLVFYPKPPVAQTVQGESSTLKTNKSKEIDWSEIAKSLVETFFNGSDDDKKEQLRALQNTVAHLQSDKSGATKLALQELKVSNINKAIKSLIVLANQQDNLRESAKTWVNIGNIQNLTSAEQALQAYKKASEFDEANSDAWNRQGHILRHLGRFSEAEIAYKKVQSLGSQSETNQAASLANFGLLNQSKGKFKQAEIAFTQALEIYTKVKNDAGIASTSENLASLYVHTKNLKKAELNYLRVLKIHLKLNNFQGAATTNAALGSLYQTMKDTEKAQAHYEQALQISQNNNLKSDAANLYGNLGILAQQNGDTEKSKEYFDKSLSINKVIKRSIGTADQYGNLAILNRTKKDYVAAEGYHLKAIEIYKENNHLHGVTSQKTNLGFLYKVWNKPQKACDAWKESLELLLKSNNKRAERVEKLVQSVCSS